MDQLSYILITPAHNEAKHIEKTIQSVISQTVLPKKWLIVENGSTDSTAAIVARYAAAHDWIELLQLPDQKKRSFSAKAHAFNIGVERTNHIDYDILGNLDADISFDETYFEFLLGKFGEDPDLGVAGTVFEEEGYSSATDSFEGQNHVPGQCQMFRRRCLTEIGGYVPHSAGGIDWIAVTTARMLGWRTRAFQERSFFHYRHLGTAEQGRLAAAFSYGEKDYYLGGHPVWEFCRFAYRATKRPYLLGGICLFAGYLWASLRRIHRPVSDELMRFHRQEQMTKLKAILRTMLKSGRLENFRLTSS